MEAEVSATGNDQSKKTPLPLRIKTSELPRRGESRRVKSVGFLRTDDSANEGTSDDGELVSPKVFRKTDVKKESFDDFIKRRRNVLENERLNISFYTSPVLVLTYFLAYMYHQIKLAIEYVRSRKLVLVSIPALLLLLKFSMLVEGAHQEIIREIQSVTIWYLYWIGLGVASSVGLGTGLHTFVLFLGPHIAEVTWVAFECGNLDFETRGSYRLRCKTGSTPVTLYRVFRKVQWESFFWGLGTAIGELPPYFVARAAALSGSRRDELETIEALMKQSPDKISYKEKALLSVHRIMQRLGFWGIFLFASIPNPLFDLAGIICGQFLVPFSTFFGATFLGKAVVKSSIQTTIVILVFSRDTLATILDTTKEYFPYIHDKLKFAVQEQAQILRGEEGVSAPNDGLVNPSYISLAWNTFFNLMLAYFALSVIETLAIAHIKRVHDKEIEKLEERVHEKEVEEDIQEKERKEILMTFSVVNDRRDKGLGRGYSSD